MKISGSPPAAIGGAHRDAVQRVLVIGDTALERQVRDILFEGEVDATIDVVDGYLLAMGEVVIEPPGVVIGRVSEVDDPPGPTAAALRHLAPGAKLLLVARADEEADAMRAMAAGFDDYVLDPIVPEDLMRAIAGDGSPSKAPPVPAAPAPPIVPPIAPVSMAAKPPVNPKSAPSLLHNLMPPDHGRPPPTYPEAKSLQSSPPTAVPISEIPAEDLGDVDLVEQLIDDPKGLRAVAMKMVAARCGIPGVAWSDTVASVPPGHTVVPVEFQGNKFGYLYAPAPANLIQFGAWSAWLARWLALEYKMQHLADGALRDELTGIWNRRYFTKFFENIMTRAAVERFRVTLLLFDIDNFKSYNDNYGHDAGDQILRQTAMLMQSVVRQHDVVARIGGDEFAVVFWDAEGPRQPNSQHPQSVIDAAKRFQRAICEHKFPKLLEGAPGTLTISGGLASFPWDGQTPQSLLELADTRAIQSKRQGKNVITFGPGAEQTCAYLPPGS